MDGERRHITVCICTYRRPELLRRLLGKLKSQETAGLFAFSLVIVDNDSMKSAEPVAREFAEGRVVPTGYHVVEEKNISLARNRAVRESRGDYVAFIDDDEFPGDDWLLNLFRASIAYGTPAVLGPVRPFYEEPPPGWLPRSKLLDRKEYPTGTFIRSTRDTRTGNVLLSRELFDGKEAPFDPRFGKTGGEDVDFFRKALSDGKRLVWCNEAVVFESVPAERLTRSYYLKRALLRGAVSTRRGPVTYAGVAKSIFAVILYTSALPVLLLLGHHWFMRYLSKDCDHIGKLADLLGIEIVKERTV